MKKIIFILAALVLSILKVSASNLIPEEVESSFHKRFPHAANVVWITTETGIFEADYSCMKYHFHTFFDGKGNIVENDLVINYNSLPDQAHYYVMNHLKGIVINEVISLQQATDQGRFILKGNLEGTNYTLHFKSDGALTKLETL